MKLYHYTDKAGYDGINKDRYIKKTIGHDGNRVYLTDLGPKNNGPDHVASILWGKGATTKMRAGRLDHFIELDIPERDIEHYKPHCFAYPRNLYVDDYRIIYQGSILSAAAEVVGMGTVAMAAVAGASALYSHSVGGREGRLQNLQNELETILNKFKADRRLADDANCYTVRTAHDEVAIYCTQCQRNVTETFEPGWFFASVINGPETMEQLRNHEFFHHSGLWTFLMVGTGVVLAFYLATKT
eukprot:scaffold1805_cov104-Cylindrotheca_fusiformis.AAC.7